MTPTRLVREVALDTPAALPAARAMSANDVTPAATTASATSARSLRALQRGTALLREAVTFAALAAGLLSRHGFPLFCRTSRCPVTRACSFQGSAFPRLRQLSFLASATLSLRRCGGELACFTCSTTLLSTLRRFARAVRGDHPSRGCSLRGRAALLAFASAAFLRLCTDAAGDMLCAGREASLFRAANDAFTCASAALERLSCL
jgi:hypothetical protein